MEYIIYGAITAKRADLGPIQASSNYKKYQEVFDNVYNNYLNPIQGNRGKALDDTKYILSFVLQLNNIDYRITILYLKNFTKFPDQGRNYDRREVYVSEVSNFELSNHLNLLKNHTPQQFDSVNLNANAISTINKAQNLIDIGISLSVINLLQTKSLIRFSQQNIFNELNKIPICISKYLNIVVGTDSIINIVPSAHILEGGDIEFSNNSTNKLLGWIIKNIDSLKLTTNFKSIDEVINYITSFGNNGEFNSVYKPVIIELLNNGKLNEANELIEILYEGENGNIGPDSLDYNNEIFISLANSGIQNLEKLKYFKYSIDAITKYDRFLKFAKSENNGNTFYLETIVKYFEKYLGEKEPYSITINETLNTFISNLINVHKKFSPKSVSLLSDHFRKFPEKLDIWNFLISNTGLEKKNQIPKKFSFNQYYLNSDKDTKELILEIYDKETIIDLVDNYDINVTESSIKKWILENINKSDLVQFLIKKEEVDKIIKNTESYIKASEVEAFELENNFKNQIDELDNSRALLHLFDEKYNDLLITHLQESEEPVIFQKIKNPEFHWKFHDVKKINVNYQENKQKYSELFRLIDAEYAKQNSNPENSINKIFNTLPLMKKFNQATELSKRLRLGSIILAIFGLVGLGYGFLKSGRTIIPSPPGDIPTNKIDYYCFKRSNVEITYRKDNNGMVDTNKGFFSNRKLNESVKHSMVGISLNSVRLYPSQKNPTIVNILPSDGSRNEFSLEIDLKNVIIKKDISVSTKVCKYINNDTEKANGKDTVSYYRYAE
jgi:hypothetical protein